MTKSCCALVFAYGLILAALSPVYAGKLTGTSSVLVIVNDSTPAEEGTGGRGAGQYVADRYVAARGIPPANVVHIQVPMACCANDPKAWDSWHIPWTEFVTKVRQPIRDYMKLKGLTTQIKYVVPTYGVPSHITSHPQGAEGMAVDSFLSVMETRIADSMASHNPNFDFDPESNVRFRFTVYRAPFYVVSRLDGPSAIVAASLVDKALAAERGISRNIGTAYFDWRHLASGSYYAADQTMTNGYELCRAAGFQCSLNDQTANGGMITSAPDTLWAWGWYSGGTVNDVYGFMPGAVGAQLTSYTALSIRTFVPGAWVPVWLERGITATWGATGEPYVSGYAMGDNLLNRLWKGYNFGQAAYLACPLLGWKMVFVGDPLYSPRFID